MRFLNLINRPFFDYIIVFLCFFDDILLANILGHQFFNLSMCLFIVILIEEARTSVIALSILAVSLLSFISYDNAVTNASIALALILLTKKLKKHVNSKFVIGYSLLFTYLMVNFGLKMAIFGQKMALNYTFYEIFVNIMIIIMFLKYFVRHDSGNRSYAK